MSEILELSVFCMFISGVVDSISLPILGVVRKLENLAALLLLLFGLSCGDPG